jgi:protein-S-isoprenylcysteine O-methyltransferase Ste14
MPKIYITALYLIFFISIIYLRLKIRNKTLKREKVPGEIIGKWTSKYIFYMYHIIFFGAFLEYFIAGREMNVILSVISLILFLIGILGRQWAWVALGKYWSVDIEIRDNHELIKKGPYKFMRHPNNFFHSLEVIAITLVPNSYYMLAIFLVVYIPVLVIRSIIEEKAMNEKFKDEYVNYKKETLGLIPKLIRG